MTYQIRHNGRGKPFEAVEWDSIMHITALHPNETTKIWVYPAYTIINTTAARYIVQPDGTYEQRGWLE